MLATLDGFRLCSLRWVVLSRLSAHFRFNSVDLVGPLYLCSHSSANQATAVHVQKLYNNQRHSLQQTGS